MKYLKMLALAGLTTAAVLGASGTATATEVTSPSGTKLGVGATVKAQLSGVAEFHSFIGLITCKKASGEGEITDAGGAGKTVKGILFIGNFSECSGTTIHVLKTGTAEVHALGKGNATMTSTGAEVTVETFGLHCIYSTNGTDFGQVTGGTPATVQVMGTIPRTGGRSGAFCGSSAPLTAELVVTSPSPLFID